MRAQPKKLIVFWLASFSQRWLKPANTRMSGRMGADSPGTGAI
jgi:hypothetical protein